MRLIVSEREYNALCELVREILIDSIDNYYYSVPDIKDLCTGDGAFTAWVGEILHILGVQKG